MEILVNESLFLLFLYVFFMFYIRFFDWFVKYCNEIIYWQNVGLIGEVREKIMKCDLLDGFGSYRQVSRKY